MPNNMYIYLCHKKMLFIHNCMLDDSIEAKTEEEATRIDLAEDEVKDLRSSITGVCYARSGAGVVSIKYSMRVL